MSKYALSSDKPMTRGGDLQVIHTGTVVPFEFDEHLSQKNDVTLVQGYK